MNLTQSRCRPCGAPYDAMASKCAYCQTPQKSDYLKSDYLKIVYSGQLLSGLYQTKQMGPGQVTEYKPFPRSGIWGGFVGISG